MDNVEPYRRAFRELMATLDRDGGQAQTGNVDEDLARGEQTATRLFVLVEDLLKTCSKLRFERDRANELLVDLMFDRRHVEDVRKRFKAVFETMKHIDVNVDRDKQWFFDHPTLIEAMDHLGHAIKLLFDDMNRQEENRKNEP